MMAAKTSSAKKRGLEYSPFGEKSKEAARRRFTKRKSSKSLLDVFVRESMSIQSEESASEFEKSANDGTPNSVEMQPQLSKRMKAMMSTKSSINDENVNPSMADEENTANNILDAQVSPPVDWDDSAARSPFDCPFIPKQKMSEIYPMDHPIDFSQLSEKKIPANAKCKSMSTKLPCDFRLGTKLRLVSEKPFPWIGKNQNDQTNYAVKNAISPNKFDKAMNNLADIDSLEKENPNGEGHPLVALQSAAIFHQFPSIGSVQLFPRRNIGASKSALKSANLNSIESNFISDLAIHWVEAFDFLFRRWICGHRKSFYLCSPQFSIIFVNFREKLGKTPQKQQMAGNSPRKPKLARTPQKNVAAFMSPNKNAKSPHRNGPSTPKSPKQFNLQHFIVVTPTTAGFRQILHENGVHFSAPFKTTAEFVNLSKEECPKDFLPMEEDAMDHDEWLKGIGISPKTTLGMKRGASQLDGPCPSVSFIDCESSTASRIPGDISGLQNGGTPPADSSSRSTILIKGSRDAESLFRLLALQLQLTSTKTGPQAGLPATLISHSTFRHSAQKELSMTSQVIRKLGHPPKYVLAMENGPILPTAIESIVDFCRQMWGQSAEIQIHLNGRHQFNGINEALEAEGKEVANFGELNLNGKRFEFI